jgi:hypothetical protein
MIEKFLIKLIFAAGIRAKPEMDQGRVLRRYARIHGIVAVSGLLIFCGVAFALAGESSKVGLWIMLPFLLLFAWYWLETLTYKIWTDALGLEVATMFSRHKLGYSSIQKIEFDANSKYLMVFGPGEKVRLTPLVTDFPGLVRDLNKYLPSTVSRSAIDEAVRFLDSVT